MVAFEEPLPGPMAERPGTLIGLEPVKRAVVGQFEQDHVVEVLRSAGVTCADWQLPAELSEARIGPPLTHDDLLDFHDLMRSSDWFSTLETLTRTTEPDR